MEMVDMEIEVAPENVERGFAKPISHDLGKHLGKLNRLL